MGFTFAALRAGTDRGLSFVIDDSDDVGKVVPIVAEQLLAYSGAGVAIVSKKAFDESAIDRDHGRSASGVLLGEKSATQHAESEYALQTQDRLHETER